MSQLCHESLWDPGLYQWGTLHLSLPLCKVLFILHCKLLWDHYRKDKLEKLSIHFWFSHLTLSSCKREYIVFVKMDISGVVEDYLVILSWRGLVNSSQLICFNFSTLVLALQNSSLQGYCKPVKKRIWYIAVVWVCIPKKDVYLIWWAQSSGVLHCSQQSTVW